MGGWLGLDAGPLEVERVTERVLERGREGMEMFDIDCEEMIEEEEDLKIMLSQSQFQVSVLEDQLKVALGEIKFLRGELSCFELELISSRSEIKVLLEELSTYKSGEESKEEFPDLLLSSLDKLYNDKQQQLWLITGIQNSIEKPNSTKGSSINVGSDTILKMSNGGLYRDFQNQEHSKLVLKCQNIANGKESILTKKQQPAMTLELKKAYDFTPSFSPSTSRNIRSLNTPSSMLSSKYQSWTPTTPTPCSALRPSFSLHNLASKTFTEVLVPSIKPPANHQVTPPQSASPKSPRFSPSALEKNVKKTPMKSQPSKKITLC